MDYFNYREGQLCAEDLSIEKIVSQYNTPCFVYSRATIERHWHAFDRAFAKQRHLICYAVKANSNLAILNILAKLGSGFDIVSGGELARVLKAGGAADKIVFSGVGKSSEEIAAALKANIRCFNIESDAELERINNIASELGLKAPISIRVNPDVDAKTHPYISTGLKENKFGVDTIAAIDLYKKAQWMENISIEGIDCHIGSQLTELAPFLDAVDRILLLVDHLKSININIHHVDIGGGLGITYDDERPPEPAEYANAIATKLAKHDLEILLEPGRAIMGNAGLLITKVEYIKLGGNKNFAIVDAAMNDLLRPALYQAWQNIIPVVENTSGNEKIYDIVGPICETGDFLGKDRMLDLKEGDLLAIRSAGAYSFTMSSNYNSRPRAAEILVDNKQAHLIRQRETIESLFENEILLDD